MGGRVYRLNAPRTWRDSPLLNRGYWTDSNACFRVSRSEGHLNYDLRLRSVHCSIADNIVRL